VAVVEFAILDSRKGSAAFLVLFFRGGPGLVGCVRETGAPPGVQCGSRQKFKTVLGSSCPLEVRSGSFGTPHPAKLIRIRCF
jgi:hypothetical protein